MLIITLKGGGCCLICVISNVFVYFDCAKVALPQWTMA